MRFNKIIVKNKIANKAISAFIWLKSFVFLYQDLKYNKYVEIAIVAVLRE